MAAGAVFDDLRADCEALWDFHSQLDDPGELDDVGAGQWGSSTALLNWQGVTVSVTGDNAGRVASLDLSGGADFDGVGLVGSISPALGHLTGLEVLNLGGNSLTGTIPPELGQLAGLWHLSLWRNELTGSIPSELSRLTNLEYLALDNNQLSGRVPSWLGQLTKLLHLDLGGNNLTGSIPLELSRLSNLQKLLLWGNDLTGPIPPALGLLISLELLHLDNNQLSGTIPSELNLLVNLTSLSLSFNDLIGPIPLSQLYGLTELELSGNRLDWTMPINLADRFDPFWSDPLNIIAYPGVYRNVTLGSKVWDVWFCDVPTGSVVVDQSATLTLLNGTIAAYFRWLSDDRYQPSFTNAGMVQGSDLRACEGAVRARRQMTPSNNRFIVIDDTTIFLGYASGDPAAEAVAMGAVSVVAAGGWPEAVHAIITHEIGHALGFPHSYGGEIYWADGSVYEGDNPMDAVSGQVELRATTGTIAINRYAAGWIDPSNVDFHPIGESRTYELRPPGAGGTQMLVLPDPQFGVYYTLGARVTGTYNSAAPKEGVEVYRVDQRGHGCLYPSKNACWGLNRRTQPFPPAEFTDGAADTITDEIKAGFIQHVHAAGEVFEVGTATVQILERAGDHFRVRVVDTLPPTVSVLPPGDSDATQTPAFAGRFSDDDGGAHESNIEIIAARGITVGCVPTHPDRFCPDRAVTRAQMMAFLVRALGDEEDAEEDAEESGAAVTTSRFSDVPDGAWYLPYVERLADLGVVEPYEDGAFRPSEPLTRRDMAVLLTRTFSHILLVTNPSGVFEDVPADALHAAEVESVFEAWVTRGCSADPRLYCPDEPVTRAQMASFLARALQIIP